MKIIGIDPGGSGAIVRLELLREDNTIYYNVDFTTMPLNSDNTFINAEAAYNWIKAHPADFTYLEHVHAIFGSSASGTFKFGRMFGGIEAVASSLNKYILVPPKTWQKSVWLPELAPLKREQMTAKEKSLKTVKTLFPTLQLKATKRSKLDHDGVVDALLIALYGFYQNNFNFRGVLPPYNCSFNSEGK